jgi:WD40 repeat protein
LKTLKGHSEIIERSAFDRRGELVATADAGGTVKIWTASPGREVIEELSWVWCVTYSPDGKLLGTTPYGRGLVVYDATSGRRCLTIEPYHEWIFRTAFSPDGRRIAAVGAHGTVTVYDIQTGQPALRSKAMMLAPCVCPRRFNTCHEQL